MKGYPNVLYMQCIKFFFTNNCPSHFDEIYVSLEINGVHKCSSYQNLNVR